MTASDIVAQASTTSFNQFVVSFPQLPQAGAFDIEVSPGKIVRAKGPHWSEIEKWIQETLRAAWPEFMAEHRVLNLGDTVKILCDDGVIEQGSVGWIAKIHDLSDEPYMVIDGPSIDEMNWGGWYRAKDIEPAQDIGGLTE